MPELYAAILPMRSRSFGIICARTINVWEENLIIELDGGQHAENFEYDQERNSWLRSQGYMVLRFWNNKMLNKMEGVLERIRLALSNDAISSYILSRCPSPVNGRGEKV